jgi:hypothetical protein
MGEFQDSDLVGKSAVLAVAPAGQPVPGWRPVLRRLDQSTPRTASAGLSDLQSIWRGERFGAREYCVVESGGP